VSGVGQTESTRPQRVAAATMAGKKDGCLAARGTAEDEETRFRPFFEADTRWGTEACLGRPAPFLGGEALSRPCACGRPIGYGIGEAKTSLEAALMPGAEGSMSSDIRVQQHSASCSSWRFQTMGHGRYPHSCCR
jgi:hypothetical protein